MLRTGLLGLLGLMFLSQLWINVNTIRFTSGYKQSMQDLVAENQEAKVLSTQPVVQKLFAGHLKNVAPAPDDMKTLLRYYMNGYHYIIVDPQAYISYTEDKRRFTPKLENYLEFLVRYAPPLKEYDHFSPGALKRFVLEHNIDLETSLSFLKRNKDGELGKLRVYDIKESLILMRQTSNFKKH